MQVTPSRERKYPLVQRKTHTFIIHPQVKSGLSHVYGEAPSNSYGEVAGLGRGYGGGNNRTSAVR